jgi:poly-D-alanine transfer protein DltD
MKYSRTLDKVLAALTFQVEGNTAQAARFFASAAAAPDVVSVVASLEKQSQAAFASMQTAKEKPSLAKLLATAKAKTDASKKADKKAVKAEIDDMMSDDNMDDVLDDMTASDETDDMAEDDDTEISLEDLDDATDDEGVEELPEAKVMSAESDEDTDVDATDKECAKMAKTTANLAALDRLKSTIKAKTK